jgi:hypothetical protein
MTDMSESTIEVEASTSDRLLDRRLRAAIERLEALPQNQSGSDRTALEQRIQEMRDHYRDAVRVR